jgi:hypothetical protein
MYRSARRLPVRDIGPPDVVPMPDPSGMLSALEAVRRQVREIGDEYADTILQLITEYAVSLTGASGGALAFVTDDKMICRARAGEPAPPLGAPVDVSRGLSGECVSTGLLVSCEDTENDPRTDPEIGRTLGIGSLVAAPIVSDVGVVGLLEIFSPHPRGFTKDHATVLDRLAEMIPRNLSAEPEAARSQEAQSAATQPEAPPSPEAASLSTATESDEVESDSLEAALVGSDLEEPSSAELVALPAASETLPEPKPEVVLEPISQPALDEDENVSDEVFYQIPETEPAHTRTTTFSFLRWALFNWAFVALLVAGVSTALGYLVGFAIGRH